jgi:triosephosphate isomerase
MARKLVIGNWKLQGSLAFNAQLLGALAEGWDRSAVVEMVVCPPAPYLAQTAALLTSTTIHWGAQDVSDQAVGAYTGESSAAMLHELGCSHALAGHSERRTRFAESDRLVAGKAVAALAGGLTPVICVGETLEQRTAGETLAVLERQVSAVVAVVPAPMLARLVFAYEPLWAIGSGRNADGAKVQEVHAFLRGLLARADLASAAAVPILYGGSVKAANAAEYAAQRDVDGVLVGGASLKAQEFLDIGAAFLRSA